MTRLPALLIAIAALGWPLSARAAPDIDVLAYDATIRVLAAEKRIEGEVVLTLDVPPPATSVVLDAEDLAIDSVEQVLGGAAHRATFATAANHLQVELPHPGATRVELRIRYKASPKRGMRFTEGEAFTYFHTPAWLPCHFDPSDRAAITMHLDVPAGEATIANGKPVSVESLPDDFMRHTWSEERGYSAYLFGFATGPLRITQCAAPARPPIFIAAADLPLEQRTALCNRYPPILEFLEKTAGVAYPEERFTLVFAREGLPQEAAGYAVLPRRYADAVATEPREDYLLIHELAHAWWGNLITCAGWEDFWLNEGMVTFLTAAFKQQEWGADEYDRERFLARRRVARLSESGKWRALVQPGVSVAEAGGTIPYSQGALVLHLLRKTIGEEPFWNALRRYTRAAASSGRLASSADLERAVREAWHHDPHFLFAQWVYSPHRLRLQARYEIRGNEVTVTVAQLQPAVWRVPLTVAVQTTEGRFRRDLVLRRREETVRMRVRGIVTSVRIDDGSALPERVAHLRPVTMLAEQAVHEPDTLGRAEALESLVAVCKDSLAGDCAVAPAAFAAASQDRARVVREQVPHPPER